MFLTFNRPFPLFQLVEIVSSFGQLAAYHFVYNEDLGGRCAFLEVWNSCCTKTRAYDINIKPAHSSVINLMEQYIDHSNTNKACAGLNGMKLGGCILTAVQVFPNPLEVQPFPCPVMSFSHFIICIDSCAAPLHSRFTMKLPHFMAFLTVPNRYLKNQQRSCS
jgi:hypothetical protein